MNLAANSNLPVFFPIQAVQFPCTSRYTHYLQIELENRHAFIPTEQMLQLSGYPSNIGIQRKEVGLILDLALSKQKPWKECNPYWANRILKSLLTGIHIYSQGDITDMVLEQEKTRSIPPSLCRHSVLNSSTKFSYYKH